MMGKVKDKLIELEDEGVIRYDDEMNCYVLADVPEPVPFDLAQYLFERHQREAEHYEVLEDFAEEEYW